MNRTVSRHEIKYIIRRADAELLKYRLPALLRRDPHALANGSYFIRSLYFDDPDFSAYRDKLNGVKERTKYRLRFYNYDDSLLFLEKKIKNGDLTGKDSVAVDRAVGDMLLRGDDSLRRAEGLLGEFGRLRQGVYRPAVIVDYDRYAYTYPTGNVRVTIDENVRTSPYQTDLFDAWLLPVPVLEEDEAVLEVKYDGFLPAPVGAILEGVPKQRCAVSKYAKCLSLLE